MRIIEKLEAGNVYHIFNSGNNGESLFKEKSHYYYFLSKYKEYCSNVLDTYAYALLNNHFHLMVRVKENIGHARIQERQVKETNASLQLSHFFNSYAQSINAQYSRKGKLFASPFKRKMVNSDSYFSSLICYIHHNPVHHRFVTDFRKWEFTSWHSIIDRKQTFLERDEVIGWFGSKKRFIEAHHLCEHLFYNPRLILE